MDNVPFNRYCSHCGLVRTRVSNQTHSTAVIEAWKDFKYTCYRYCPRCDRNNGWARPTTDLYPNQYA